MHSSCFFWLNSLCCGAGNVVLYNVALLAKYGSATAAAAVWASSTFSNGPQPFTLHMQAVSTDKTAPHHHFYYQSVSVLHMHNANSLFVALHSAAKSDGVAMPQDCNLVLYTAAGNAPSNAVYSTGTYGQGSPPCSLTVSGVGGGYITVADSNHTVLYLEPTSFGVLIDAGYNTSITGPNFALDENEVYNVAAAAVSQTATNPSQFLAAARTLLPTINAALSVGSSSTLDNNTELYMPATKVWVEAAAVPRGRQEADLVTLFSGNALLVGGAAANGIIIPDCEIYSPGTGAWTATGPLATARLFSGTTLLNNGKVLTAGGSDTQVGPNVYASAELYNPLSGTWSSKVTSSPLFDSQRNAL